MFDKNNTNFNGEAMCISCRFYSCNAIHHNIVGFCLKDDTKYYNVGVCNKYVELKKDI